MAITRESIVRHCGWALGLAALVAASGCGSSQPPATGGAEQGAAQPAGTHESGSAAATAAVNTAPARKAASNEVYSDGGSRKWIGSTPYDVFYEDPLAVASNTQSVAAVAAKTNDATPTAAPAESAAGGTAADKPAGGGDASDWKSIVPMKILEAETKKIRNRLTDNLQSIGKYNGNYKEIQVDGAVLAALGGIVSEHPDEVAWKANAKYVRDFGMQIEANSQGLGKKPYDATQAAFEQLVAVLDGNKPAAATEVADKVPFNESADRAGLMKRMDRAFGHMKKNVTTEAIFKSTADEVAHETVMLAAMSKVVSVPGYLSSDEDQYKKHAQALIAACMDMEKSIQTQDFKQFSDALNRVTKKCDECHVDYRFADGT